MPGTLSLCCVGRFALFDGDPRPIYGLIQYSLWTTQRQRFLSPITLVVLHCSSNRILWRKSDRNSRGLVPIPGYLFGVFASVI